MIPPVLNMLIESACSEGTLSASDRALLEKKANELGVSLDELNTFINNKLSPQPVGEFDSESSGFVIAEQLEDSASGFVMKEDEVTESIPQPKVETKEKTFEDKLTDLQVLSKQGAMSIVSKGKLYGKWIIVKRIKPEFKDNPEYKSLFLKEFENSYNLDHENIVKILDKGEDSNGLYYTMEYVDGRPLSDCIKNGELKNEKLIKSVVKQLCSALSYVHKKQIVHRDLKPDNIMVTYRGDNVKILDFGIAYTDSYDDNLVKVGTPKYAAPEQNGKGNLVDQRADIYALGLILLEMSTGSLQDRQAQTVENPNFKLVITKATKPNPEDRYHDCEELLEDLNKTIVIPVSQVPEPPQPPVRQEEPKKEEVINQPPIITPIEEEKKKKSILPFVLIAALLIAVGVFFFLKNKNGNPNSPKQQEIVENNNNTENNSSNNNVQNPDNKTNNGSTVEPKKQEEPKKNDYTDAEKNEGSEVNSVVKDLAQKADELFDAQNIAKAKILYDSIKKINDKYQNDNIDKCNKILKEAQLKDLVKDVKNGKVGFVDSKGNVIIDYLYDNADYGKTGHLKDNLYALQKNGKWGVIDNKTKQPVCEFKYAAAKGIQNGFEMRFKGIGPAKQSPKDTIITR